MSSQHAILADRQRPHTERLRGAVDAAGQVRTGSIKRVAAAVGEGSTAAMLAREALQSS